MKKSWHEELDKFSEDSLENEGGGFEPRQTHYRSHAPVTTIKGLCL